MGFRCLNCGSWTSDPGRYSDGCEYGLGCGFRVGRFEPDNDRDESVSDGPPGCLFSAFAAFAAGFIVGLPVKLIFGDPYGDIVLFAVAIPIFFFMYKSE